MITRYSDLIVRTTSPLPSPSHYTLRQLTAATSTSELTSIKKTAKKYGVIGIDEGQFVSANACSVGSVTSHTCSFFSSSQTLLSSVRTWQMRERRSSWLHLTAPSKERYTHDYCCCRTWLILWPDPPAVKLSDFGLLNHFFLERVRDGH